MHMCGLVFTKEFPSNDTIGDILDPFDEMDGENPDGKYDWYEPIGRFGGSNPFIPAQLKVGPTMVSKVDISGYDEDLINAIKESIEKGTPHDDLLTLLETYAGSFIFDEAEIKRLYGSVDTYAKWYARKVPGIVFISSDGKWHQPYDEYFYEENPKAKERYLEEIESYIADHQDEYVTMIDFHF